MQEPTTNEDNQQIYSPKEAKKRLKELNMKERGIYTNPKEESFKADTEIKREFALRGELPVFETPLPGQEKKFDYWAERFRERQKQYKETAILVEKQHVEISFNEDTIINFIGDTHIGSPEVYYDRLEQELRAIVNTPNSYVILVGDLVDGFMFNPPQALQMEQPQEQWAFTDSLMKYLSVNKRLLIGFGGDHDASWFLKSGIDPYYKFSQDLGAYYMHGVGHLTAKIGKTAYKLTGAHKLPGHSIRDNTWASKRASAEIQGADIYFSAHTHKKGHSLQAIKDFGGTARKVHFLSLGPYKSSDEYSRKHGWAQQSPEEMFGCSIILKKDSKKIDYFDDILAANTTSAPKTP